MPRSGRPFGSLRIAAWFATVTYLCRSAILHAAGKASLWRGPDLDGVPSEEFFALLLSMTVEGFFSDPAYGGNHDMVAWRMIGFPGAYADYYDAIDRHGVKFEREPMSLAEDSRGHLHPDPNIPAHL